MGEYNTLSYIPINVIKMGDYHWKGPIDLKTVPEEIFRCTHTGCWTVIKHNNETYNIFDDHDLSNRYIVYKWDPFAKSFLDKIIIEIKNIFYK